MTLPKPTAYQNSIFRIDPRQNKSNTQTITSTECYNLARTEGYNPDDAFAQSAWVVNGSSPFILGDGSSENPYHWLIGAGSTNRSYIRLIKLNGVGINPEQTFSYAFCIEPNVELSNQGRELGFVVDIFNIGNFRVGWDGSGMGIGIQRYINSIGVTSAYPLNILLDKKYLLVINISPTNIEFFINGKTLGQLVVTEGSLDSPTGDLVIASNLDGVQFKLYGLEIFNKNLSTEEIIDIAKNIYDIDFDVDMSQTNTEANITISDTVIKNIPTDNSFFGANWNFLTGDLRAGTSTMWNTPSLADEFANKCKDIGINMFRFAGGHDVACVWWDLHEQITSGNKTKAYLQTLMTNTRTAIPAISSWMPAVMPYTPTTQEFLTFLKANKFKTTLQLNLHNYWDQDNNRAVLLKADPYINGERQWGTGEVNWDKIDYTCESLKTLAQYIVDNDMLGNVPYFEVGNEDYTEDALELESKYTGEEYAEICCRVIDAITSIIPNAKFIITGCIQNDRFVNPSDSKLYVNTEPSLFTSSMLSYQKLKDRAKYIYGISHHHYAYSDNENTSETNYEYSTYVNRYWSAGTVNSLFKDYLVSKGWSNLKVMVNETNNSGFTSLYNHSWLSCIRLIQNFIGSINAENIAHIDYHTIIHETTSKGILWGFGLLHYSKSSTDKLPKNIEAYIHKIFNNIATGDVLTTQTDNQEVIAACVKNNNNYKLVILSLKDSHNVSVDLSNLPTLDIKRKRKVHFYNTFTALNHSSSYDNSTKNKHRVLKNKLGVANNNNIITMTMAKNELVIIDLKE